MSVMSRIADSLDKMGYWTCPRCHLVKQHAPAKCPWCSPAQLREHEKYVEARKRHQAQRSKAT